MRASALISAFAKAPNPIKVLPEIFVGSRAINYSHTPLPPDSASFIILAPRGLRVSILQSPNHLNII